MTAGAITSGKLMGYYETGMEWVDACLEPPGGTKSRSDLLRLCEGDEIRVWSPDTGLLWQGVLRLSWWSGRPVGLPDGWQEWFARGHRADLVRRGVFGFWRRAPAKAFFVTPNR